MFNSFMYNSITAEFKGSLNLIAIQLHVIIYLVKKEENISIIDQTVVF